MKNFLVLLKLLGFGFFMMMIFAVASNVVPQAIGEPPPVIDLRSIDTVDKMVELGGEIFGSEAEPGRGKCPMCHRRIGGRAPVLDGITNRAATRIKDPQYKGHATTGLEYIEESEECPSCFVVAGFGKPGTNDAVSPMPVTVNPPIYLSAIERDSVVAFFQDRDGNDVTVKPITDPEKDLRWDKEKYKYKFKGLKPKG